MKTNNPQVLKKLLSTVLGSCLMLNSCATATADLEKSIDKTDNKIKQIQKDSQDEKSIVNRNLVTTVPDGIFTSQAIKDRHSNGLPQAFYHDIKVNNTFINIKSAADAISDLSGITVSVSLSSKSSTNNQPVYIYQKNGNLINLLDKIATKYDLDWTYSDGIVEFSDVTTQTWSINTTPGDYSMQNNINNTIGLSASNSGSSSSAGGGSGSSSNSSTQSGSAQGTQTLSFSTSGSIWSDIASTIKTMLSSNGKMTTSSTDSTVTVTDQPHVIRLVDKYIKKENEIIGRQVKIDVKLLQVTVSDEDSYGINWNGVLKGITAGGGITTPGASSNTGLFTINANSGDLNTSSLILNALSTLNKTSVITDATVITHNNQPVPLQSATQTAYVASTSATVTTDVGTSTAVTPGVYTTGFTMNVLPNILANQQINLQITLNLSTLVKLEPFSATGDDKQTVQLPSVATKSFMQKVSLNSGQTLVLSGFDDNSNTLNNQGVGKSSNWVMGSSDKKKYRERLVVLITPQVIETN